MKWTVPYDLPFFNGHFPEGSILPAVISLEASLELIGLSLKREKVILKEVKTAKFFAPITPGSKLLIYGTMKSSENHWLVDWFEESEEGEGKKTATFSKKDDSRFVVLIFYCNDVSCSCRRLASLYRMSRVDLLSIGNGTFWMGTK